MYSGEDFRIAYKAAADLRNYQYRAVRVSAEGQVNVASAITGTSTFLGVLLNAPNTNEAAEIAIAGVAKMVANGSITAGGLVTHSASGYVTAATSGTPVIGRALGTSSNADDVIPVLIAPVYSATA